MALSFTSDWTCIGDEFIRCTQLFGGDGLLPISKASLVASCLYGGPLAIASPVDEVGGAWRISILTANGHHIGEVTASSVSHVFWSQCQKLVVLGATGRVLLYNPLGMLLNSFTMGEVLCTPFRTLESCQNDHFQESQELGVSEAKIFTHSKDSGLAVLNRVGQAVYAVNSIDDPVLWRVTSAVKEAPLSCWAVLSNTRPTSVLLCYSARFYSGLMEERARLCQFDWGITTGGSYLAMEQSHVLTGKDASSLLLLVHDSGVMQIVSSSDLHVLVHTIQYTHSPVGLEERLLPLWCRDAHLNSQPVIALRRGTTSTVDFYAPPDRSCAVHFPQAIVHLTAEIDGIRAFSNSGAHFLSPVSQSSRQVLGLTSSEPGALLFEASLKLDRRDHTFYEYIKLVGAGGEGMLKAVEQCLDAVVDQSDPKAQKSLLRAAQIGRALCDEIGGHRSADHNKLYQLARELRIVNNLRDFGLALSIRELRLLTTLGLVDRLVALQHWPLAIKICEVMEISIESGIHRVLASWCTRIMEEFKVQQKSSTNPFEMDASHTNQSSEEHVAKKILRRLESFPGMSYADIADVAARKGLNRLAHLLLEKEPSLGRQVVVLLKLKEVDRALTKAAQSQQPDLMHLVLKHMRKTAENSGELELQLRRIPQALSLYQSYVREEAPDKALYLYEQGDDFVRQAIHHLGKVRDDFDRETFFDASKAAASLAKAEKALHAMRDQQGAQLVAGCSQLMLENAKREEKHLTSLVEKSPRQTFIWAVASGDEHTIEVLKKQHRLDERQMWCWTVEGLAQGGRWQTLEQFGRTKRSSIGSYLPLIEACCRHGNSELATSFLDKVANYEEQIRAYLVVG